MKMTPALVVIGSLMVFWCSVALVVVLPTATMNELPSEAWEPWSAEEAAGHDLRQKESQLGESQEVIRVRTGLDEEKKQLGELGQLLAAFGLQSRILL
jgi:hypothetical protein